MKVRGATEQNLQDALYIVNSHYEGNVTLARDKAFPFFALRVVSLDGPGTTFQRRYDYRTGAETVKRSRSACWHVHGWVFDALFTVAPDAIVDSAGTKITRNAGNWTDWNVGSSMFPIDASDQCECDGDRWHRADDYRENGTGFVR
jgi:hypothetical protein